MTGQYQHSVDAKGRLFIPVKLREELGDTFYVTVSGTDPCLAVYSEEVWKHFEEKFAAMPRFQAKRVRALFANAAKCEPDAQGRILLPSKLRAYAKLEKDVTIAGVSDHAEIWNTDAWNEVEAEELDLANLGAAMEELGF